MTSLYEHAGADEGLLRLEEIFYSKVLAGPVLKSPFTERRPHNVEHLAWFTTESLAGPDRFTREPVSWRRSTRRARPTTNHPAGSTFTCSRSGRRSPAELAGRDRRRSPSHP